MAAHKGQDRAHTGMLGCEHTPLPPPVVFSRFFTRAFSCAARQRSEQLYFTDASETSSAKFNDPRTISVFSLFFFFILCIRLAFFRSLCWMIGCSTGTTNTYFREGEKKEKEKKNEASPRPNKLSRPATVAPAAQQMHQLRAKVRGGGRCRPGIFGRGERWRFEFQHGFNRREVCSEFSFNIIYRKVPGYFHRARVVISERGYTSAFVFLGNKHCASRILTALKVCGVVVSFGWMHDET